VTLCEEMHQFPTRDPQALPLKFFENNRGNRGRSLLKHCATSRKSQKVAGSTLNGVIGIFR